MPPFDMEPELKKSRKLHASKGKTDQPGDVHCQNSLCKVSEVVFCTCLPNNSDQSEVLLGLCEIVKFILPRHK